jgi:hypothetical protein
MLFDLFYVDTPSRRGDVNSCGDWLALTLKEAFRSERQLRFDGVQALLEGKRHPTANGRYGAPTSLARRLGTSRE